MERNYGALFCKEKDGKYSVFLLDYDMATGGSNLEEARSMAKELLELAFETYGKRNPKNIDNVNKNELYFERTGEYLQDKELNNSYIELL